MTSVARGSRQPNPVGTERTPPSILKIVTSFYFGHSVDLLPKKEI